MNNMQEKKKEKKTALRYYSVIVLYIQMLSIALLNLQE